MEKGFVFLDKSTVTKFGTKQELKINCFKHKKIKLIENQVRISKWLEIIATSINGLTKREY